VQQFAGLQQPPAWIFIHRFARDDDRRSASQILGVDTHAARGSAVVQMPVAMMAAGAALKHIQTVGTGIAQSPQLVLGGEQQVE
jgi:hypothetical protein